MAQFVNEPSPSAALEEASVTASLSHTLTPTAPFASHFVAPGEPLFVFGHWVAPEPATEAVTVTTVCALEVSLAPPSQGYVTFDTHPAAASFGLGTLPSGQSMSLPLASGPSPALQFSIPTNGTPEMQYQHLLGLAQHLLGLALSVCPPVILEVPLQPFLQFQSFSTAPLPLPLPQLLTTPTMGASSLPPVHQLHTTQHFTPSSGGQPLGMTGT